jgi:hypothetical protein
MKGNQKPSVPLRLVSHPNTPNTPNFFGGNWFSFDVRPENARWDGQLSPGSILSPRSSPPVLEISPRPPTYKIWKRYLHFRIHDFLKLTPNIPTATCRRTISTWRAEG